MLMLHLELLYVTFEAVKCTMCFKRLKTRGLQFFLRQKKDQIRIYNKDYVWTYFFSSNLAWLNFFAQMLLENVLPWPFNVFFALLWFFLSPL